MDIANYRMTPPRGRLIDNQWNCSWPDKDIRHDDGPVGTWRITGFFLFLPSSVGTWRITRVLPLLIFFCWHFVDHRILPLLVFFCWHFVDHRVLVFLTSGRVSNSSVPGSAPLVHLWPLYMHSISLEKRWRVQINSRWQNFSEELWERESL